MTVNKKNRLSYFLPVLLFLSSTAFGVQKNILYVHFDTAHVAPGIFDKVLNVRYRIKASRPYAFTGYHLRLVYQPSMTPTNVFFDGTASGKAGLAHFNNTPSKFQLDILVD